MNPQPSPVEAVPAIQEASGARREPWLFVSWGYRAAAFLTDIAVAVALGTGAAGLTAAAGTLTADNRLIVGGLVTIVAWVLFTSLVPAVWDGSTFGKRLVAIRVVRLSERPTHVGWSFYRDTICKGIMFVAALLVLVDYLMPLWTRNRQALHDKMAGTLVIQRSAYGQRGGVALLVGILALCGFIGFGLALRRLDQEKNGYTTSEREQFVAGCSEGRDALPATTCDCTFTYLTEHLSHDRFVALDARGPTAHPPKVLLDALESCR